MEDTDKKENDLATADAEFERILNTPLSKEDAEKELADIEVRKMQLMVVRQKWQAQVTQAQMNLVALDEQVYALDMQRAVVFRRTLNPGDAKQTSLGDIVEKKEG